MKILYYDCFAGISGDMHLGAMIDMGIAPEYLIEKLSKLGLDGEYEIRTEKKEKLGIAGTKVDVFPKATDGGRHSHPYPHVHPHAGGEETHPQRHFGEIREIVLGSGLPDEVKERSMKIFTRLANAEGKVHGIPPEEVHFHEVGAIDSIVDIVGAAICIEYFKPDRILCSPIQVGGGTVRCAHGTFPVPAPATAELLRNLPILSGLVQGEATTPTGAAILAANVDEFTNTYRFSIEKIGYGLGTRDVTIPNVLRVFLGNS